MSELTPTPGVACPACGEGLVKERPADLICPACGVVWPKWPEHLRLHAVKDQTQSICTFLDWLQNEKGYRICEYNQDGLVVTCRNIVDMVAEYFEIDQVKLEREKRQMLAQLQKPHVTPEGLLKEDT